MKRTRLERETTITFNEAELDAIIWSATPSIQRRMKRIGFKPYRKSGDGLWYKVPKKLVQIRKPYQHLLRPSKSSFSIQKSHEITPSDQISTKTYHG